MERVPCPFRVSNANARRDVLALERLFILHFQVSSQMSSSGSCSLPHGDFSLTILTARCKIWVTLTSASAVQRKENWQPLFPMPVHEGRGQKRNIAGAWNATFSIRVLLPHPRTEEATKTSFAFFFVVHHDLSAGSAVSERHEHGVSYSISTLLVPPNASNAHCYHKHRSI